jgi:hypothetical protein
MNISLGKLLIIYVIKLSILFLFCFTFFIFPVLGLVKHGAESFNKNKYVSIIIIDFIDNPLTFLRLAEHYLDIGEYKLASLYIEYAKVTNSRYSNSEIVLVKIKRLEALLEK